MARPASRMLNFLRVFRRDQGGTIAETALVSLPFIALLFGVLELGVIFMVQTTLENASYAVARQIRTGEFQLAGGTAATFKTAMCNQMGWLGGACAANLSVDVRSYTEFDKVKVDSVITNGAVDPTKEAFIPGTAGDIVLVRCFYTWTLITPVLNQGLKNLKSSKRLLSSSVAFRNEPYLTQ
jgi:Flp pilus assembly protein TadG